MELVDFTEEFRASTFKVFSGAIANGGVVKALNAKGLAGATQGQMEAMTETRRASAPKASLSSKSKAANGNRPS